MVPAQTDEILTSFDDDIHSFFFFFFFFGGGGGGVFGLCVRGWGAGDVGRGGGAEHRNSSKTRKCYGIHATNPNSFVFFNRR